MPHFEFFSTFQNWFQISVSMTPEFYYSLNSLSQFYIALAITFSDLLFFKQYFVKAGWNSHGFGISYKNIYCK